MSGGDIAVRKAPPRNAEALRAKLASTGDALAAARDAVGDLDGRLEANTAAEVAVALGELTVEEVAEQRTRLLQEREVAREEVRRLEAAAAGLPGRIAEAEEREAAASWRRADDRHAAAARARDQAVDDLRLLLEPLVPAVQRLHALRVAYDKAAVAASADVSELYDEPDPRPAEIEAVIQALLEGPRTPAADAERRARSEQARIEASDTSRVRSDADYVADYFGSDLAEGRIAAAPEHLRDRIRERAAEIRRQRLEDYAQANREARERAMAHADPMDRRRLEEAQAADDELQGLTVEEAGDAHVAAQLDVARENQESLP